MGTIAHTACQPADPPQNNIESCGILAGVLSANDSSFTITTLIIPKQQGTTDTVQVRGGTVGLSFPKAQVRGRVSALLICLQT